MSRLVQLCAIVCGFLAALSCVRAQTDPQDRMVHVAISQFAENNPNEAVLEPTVEAIRDALGGDNVVVHRLPLDRPAAKEPRLRPFFGRQLSQISD